MKTLRLLALFALIPFCIGQTTPTATKPADTKKTDTAKKEAKKANHADHKAEHKAGMDCCTKDGDDAMSCHDDAKDGDKTAEHKEHAAMGHGDMKMDCCKKDGDKAMDCCKKNEKGEMAGCKKDANGKMACSEKSESAANASSEKKMAGCKDMACCKKAKAETKS